MFIGVLELFKIGVGPSSSHTMGPMLAACEFSRLAVAFVAAHPRPCYQLRCILKGSLSATGRGHATDRAIALGMHGYRPEQVAELDLESLLLRIGQQDRLAAEEGRLRFSPEADVVFDDGPALDRHPNGMIFQLLDDQGMTVLERTVFSIGGGFVVAEEAFDAMPASCSSQSTEPCPFAFASAESMLTMAETSGASIATMKRANELARGLETRELDAGLDRIWQAMKRCVERGIVARGELPGGLGIVRRAARLHERLEAAADRAQVPDWLCAYAMAVNEENAAGHMVVTAPTNGAAGVIPAVLYHLVCKEGGKPEQVREFLLTAAAIGGLIKHNSSISGAEVGCQGEVGSAAAMAAAGLCAVRGGSPAQVEHAAEIALEHHIGMTCDPVAGLVQVPCIERNGFGAVKASTAAYLALHESGRHFMPLDNCIAAMKQTGEEMSVKFKETSRGGLAVNLPAC